MTEIENVPYKLPEDWKWVELKNISKIVPNPVLGFAGMSILVTIVFNLLYKRGLEWKKWAMKPRLKIS